jgi:hypothetical protein
LEIWNSKSKQVSSLKMLNTRGNECSQPRTAWRPWGLDSSTSTTTPVVLHVGLILHPPPCRDRVARFYNVKRALKIQVKLSGPPQGQKATRERERRQDEAQAHHDQTSNSIRYSAAAALCSSITLQIACFSSSIGLNASGPCPSRCRFVASLSRPPPQSRASRACSRF